MHEKDQARAWGVTCFAWRFDRLVLALVAFLKTVEPSKRYVIGCEPISSNVHSL